MKPKHVNITTYDDFEKLDSFAGGMDRYRASKLKSAEGHVGFIRKFFPKKKITVLELGSGNSKTLFALEKAGALQKGYGLEISKSRYAFAELWKKEGGFERVENKNEDILKTDFSEFDNVDLCFCVDLTLQFLEPAQKGSVDRVLADVCKKLQPKGRIIVEVDGLEKVLGRMRGNSVKFWEEFAAPDPWQYSLWDCNFDQKNKFLDIKKVFLKRNEFGMSENRMILRLYKRADLQKLLEETGFSKVTFYANWKGEKFKDDKGEYIAIGAK